MSPSQVQLSGPILLKPCPTYLRYPYFFNNYISNKFHLNFNTEYLVVENKCKLTYTGDSSQLNFKEHVSYIRSKLVPRIKVLDKLKHILNRQTQLTPNKTLLGPLFDYCGVVYNGIGQAKSQTLQKLQNSALRRILNCNSRTPTVEMHARLNLDTLDIRRFKHVNTQTYKCLHDLAPPQISTLVHV